MNISKLLLQVALFFLCSSCANIVAPTGGLKDTEPPQTIKIIPQNYSTHYNSPSVYIKFDEFFQLKDPNNQIVISPPFNNKPTFKVKNKYLETEITDTLKDNTTYTINFGDAIQDITENNVLSDFQFVFSTGAFIDSFSVKGMVKQAGSNQPAKAVLVMMYADHNDSVVYKQKPLYFDKTDENGNFEINNIREDNYKIFALKDINSNYLYDAPNEEIAFADSLVSVNNNSLYTQITSYKYINDSLIIFRDSLKNSSPLYLTLFTENNVTQRLISAKAKVWYSNLLGKKICTRIVLVFKKPVENLSLLPLSDNTLGKPILNYSLKKDTITCWIINPSSYDTLSYIVRGLEETIDTISLAGDDVFIDTSSITNTFFNISCNLTGEEIDILSPVILYFPYPVIYSDLNKITLKEDSLIILENLQKSDSVVTKRNANPSISFIDSSFTSIKINYEWKQKFSYKLNVPDSVLWNLFGKTNDSLEINFTTKPENQFGNILFKVTVSDSLRTANKNDNYIVQLTDEKNSLITENIIVSGQNLNYKFLKPQKYKLKIIYDTNRNNKWDTGNYTLKIQPEKVSYYESEINLRANWEMELEYQIK